MDKNNNLLRLHCCDTFLQRVRYCQELFFHWLLYRPDYYISPQLARWWMCNVLIQTKQRPAIVEKAS